MANLMELICCIFQILSVVLSQRVIVWKLTGKSSIGSQQARIGEDFVLACEVQTIPYNFIWLRNDVIVASILDGKCKDLTDVEERYTYTCDGNHLFVLIIPGENMTYNEEGTTWSCSNSAGLKSNKFVLYTMVPVKKVSISPNYDINIDEGDLIELSCVTSSCRPKAKIIWYEGNTTKDDMGINFAVRGNTYVTSSNMIEEAKIKNDKTNVYCTASNSLDDTVYSDKITINVNYPPQREPYIEDFLEKATLNEYENVTFSCILSGGNPLANLTWNCFGIKGNIKNQKEKAVSKISFISNKTMNGQLCTCIASHRVNNYKRKVQLNISIRPTKAFEIGEFSHPLIVAENERIILRCKENDSISVDTFWKKSDRNIIVEGNHLHLQSITCFDTGNYSCQPRYMDGSTESSCLEVYVKCKPRILNRSSEMTKLFEGEPFTISLEFISHPYPEITLSLLQNKTKKSISLANNGNGFWILKGRILYAYTLQVVKNKMYSEDFGVYELLLFSENGNESTTFIVKEKDTPNKYPRKTLFTKYMLFIVIPSSIVAAVVFIIVPLVIKKTLSRSRRRKKIGMRKNYATENQNVGSIADSPNSTSYISEDGSVFYVNYYIETRDYQNACRIKELEAEGPYGDLEPEDKVQLSYEWPYEEIDRDSPGYLEPVLHHRSYSGGEHEIKSDTQSYMERDPI